MTKYLIILMPVFVLCIHCGLALYSADKLSKRESTQVFSKQGWILIIVFLGIIGPIAYLMNEER